MFCCFAAGGRFEFPLMRTRGLNIIRNRLKPSMASARSLGALKWASGVGPGGRRMARASAHRRPLSISSFVSFIGRLITLAPLFYAGIGAQTDAVLFGIGNFVELN